MLVSSSFLLALLPALSAAIAPGCNTNGPFYPLATGLANSTSALSYCSANYPVAATTIGLAGQVRTANSTIATTIITSTTGNSSTTVTAPAVTSTNTLTVLATTTVTQPAVAKRELNERAAVFVINGTSVTRAAVLSRTTTLSPQQSMMSQLTAQAASIVSQVCLCIETQPTVTAQLNDTTITQGVTGTITTFVAGSVTFTSTPTVTAFATVTSTQTVTVTANGTVVPSSTPSVEATTAPTQVPSNTVVTSVAPTTSSTTSVPVTSVSTSTAPGATAGVRAGAPSCGPADNSNNPGTGGCSANCYCDARINQLNGQSAGAYCSQTTDCSILNIAGGQYCGQDSDCPADTVCDASAFLQTQCGGPVCASYSGCTTTFLGKRGALELGSSWESGPWNGRMQKKGLKLVKRVAL